MASNTSATIDGVRCNLNYFTGRVLSTKKDKETRISSHTVGTNQNPQTHVTSTTVDHHEFFLADKDGKERSFHLVDLDFPCREGQTVSVVWMIPEGKDSGPYIHVRNHNSNEYVQIHPHSIADNFKKPWWMMWGSGIGLSIVAIPVLGPVSMIMILIPFFYLRHRSRKAAKNLLQSPEVMGLDAELARIKPMTVVPAAA